MDDLTGLIVALAGFNLLILSALAIYIVRSRKRTDSTDMEQTLQLLKTDLLSRQSESLHSIRESIDRAHSLMNERLTEGTSSLDRRLEVVGEIQNQLGQLAKQAEQIESVGQNISTLSQLLKAPKVRGGVGETLLENLLGEILPRSMFEIQYTFDGGKRVDAVVRIAERFIPIDAKFPLEAFSRMNKEPENKSYRREFNQSLKKHVDDIADKYINPQQKTTDFALMYLPAERIYYELIAGSDETAFEYALSRKVIPTSPGHLYGFLATVSSIYSQLQLSGGDYSAGSEKLSASLSELGGTLGRLQKLLERMQGSVKSLSLTLGKARDESDNMDTELKKISQLEQSDSEEMPVGNSEN